VSFPTNDVPITDSDSALPGWLWPVIGSIIGVCLLLLLAAVILCVMRRKQKDDVVEVVSSTGVDQFDVLTLHTNDSDMVYLARDGTPASPRPAGTGDTSSNEQPSSRMSMFSAAPPSTSSTTPAAYGNAQQLIEEGGVGGHYRMAEDESRWSMAQRAGGNVRRSADMSGVSTDYGTPAFDESDGIYGCA
jgi:hypothetical protein